MNGLYCDCSLAAKQKDRYRFHFVKHDFNCTMSCSCFVTVEFARFASASRQYVPLPGLNQFERALRWEI